MKTAKKVFPLVMAIALALASFTAAFAGKSVGYHNQGSAIAWSNTNCAKIQSGTITDSAGNVIRVGFDQFGYNYQAHQFNGTYDSSDRVLDGKYFGSTVWYATVSLSMAWSDEWLANVDCNGDHKLDRGLVNGVYTDGISKGWLTNHEAGYYAGDHFTYFVKIVYGGTGAPIWGAYSIEQEVYNDPANGINGLLTLVDPGLGHFRNQ